MSLHVKIGRVGQPYITMAIKLADLRFEEAKITLNRIPAVNVIGGTDSDLLWKIALRPEDAADLQALIAKILAAAESL